MNDEFSTKRRIYRVNDLEEFKKETFNYLTCFNNNYIYEWCEWVGISRQTLSNYKKRNDAWRELIEEIKREIWVDSLYYKYGGV